MEEGTWIEKYYREIDKKERKRILEQGIEEDGMTMENELRKKLWEIRYGRREKETVEVDHYIRGWMSMYYLKRALRSMFRKKNLQKSKEEISSDWGMDAIQEYGEAGERVFYQELCNMTRLYLTLCAEDKTYSSVLLGIGRMKNASLIAKMAREVFTLAYEIPRQSEMEDTFRIFTKAATDTFYEMYPKEKEVLQGLIEAENA